MKQLLAMLLYVTGFIQGDFLQALKNVFNVESVKHIFKDDDGLSVINIDTLLDSLKSKFGNEVQQMYLSLMFVNIIEQKQLVEFFSRGHQGIRAGDGYFNLNLIIEFFKNHLLHEKITYEYYNERVCVENFVKLLEGIPTGQVKVLKSVKCKHCNDGYVDDDLECYVCNGSGEVEQWTYEGTNLNDSDLFDIQGELVVIAPNVAKILNDYIQYYISDFIYKNHEWIDTSRTSSNEFMYLCDSFTTPFLCNLAGAGKFPTEEIKVAYTYEGFEFNIPLLVVDEDLVAKPEVSESRFNSTAGEKITHVASVKVTDEEVVTKSKFIYTKRSGQTVTGFSEVNPDWDKYYTGVYKALVVHFNYHDYTRDEVRQAFAGIAEVAKSQISIETLQQ